MVVTVKSDYPNPYGTVRGKRLTAKILCETVDTLIMTSFYKTAFRRHAKCDWLAPQNLATLIQLASSDMHGGVALFIDGDCFEPPECTCVITGWPFASHRGAGGTLNEAVLRALHIREIRHAKWRANSNKENVYDGI